MPYHALNMVPCGDNLVEIIVYGWAGQVLQVAACGRRRIIRISRHPYVPRVYAKGCDDPRPASLAAEDHLGMDQVMI